MHFMSRSNQASGNPETHRGAGSLFGRCAQERQVSSLVRGVGLRLRRGEDGMCLHRHVLMTRPVLIVSV